MNFMETVAGEFPDIMYVHLTGYKIERHQLRQPVRRHGGHQVPRRHARRLARQGGRQPQARVTWPPSRSQRKSGWATRSCWAPRRPAPSARWRSAGSTPGTARQQRRDGAASLFDAGAEVVLTGADTGANADVAKDKGKWAVTYDHPASCHNDACLTAMYWIWGPVYARTSRTRSSPAPISPVTSTSTLTARRWACAGFMPGETLQPGVANLPAADLKWSATRSQDACRRPLTGSTSSPARSRTTLASRSSRRAQSCRRPTSISSRQARRPTPAPSACSGWPRASTAPSRTTAP